MTRTRQRPTTPSGADPDDVRLDDELSLRAPEWDDTISSDDSPTDDPSFSREEAEEIWRLAARMQAEAAHRLEGRSRELAGWTEMEKELRDFSLGEIKEIARAAGLEDGFIELALRERAAAMLLSKRPNERQKGVASKVLGTDQQRITVSKVIKADKKTVLDAMQRIFPADPYRLELLDVVGDEGRLENATLVFGVPQMDAGGALVGFGQSAGGFRFMYNMTISDLNRMLVSLHALDEERTEVTVQLDTGYGQWRNTKWSLLIAAAFTIAVALVGGGLLSVGGFGFVATLLGTLVMAAMTSFVSVKGYGAAYRNGLQKGEKEMAELLCQIDVNVRTGGAFAGSRLAPGTGMQPLKAS